METIPHQRAARRSRNNASIVSALVAAVATLAFVLNKGPSHPADAGLQRPSSLAAENATAYIDPSLPQPYEVFAHGVETIQEPPPSF